MSNNDREKLQIRVEYELTPAEPDPEFRDSNSKEYLESQLMSEIDPVRIKRLVEKIRRGNEKPRGMWDSRTMKIPMAQFRTLPVNIQDLILIIMSKERIKSLLLIILRSESNAIKKRE